MQHALENRYVFLLSDIYFLLLSKKIKCPPAFVLVNAGIASLHCEDCFMSNESAN